MISACAHALCGTAVAVSAWTLYPGRDDGYLIPIVLGAVGGWAADRLAAATGVYRPGQPMGYMVSSLGAVALLLAYGIVRG